MMFGRVFEQGLASYSRREDSVAVPFREWAMYQKANLELPTLGDRMLQQGMQSLEHFAQDD